MRAGIGRTCGGVYWRRLSGGDIGIVTILHERMHQIERFREGFLDAP